MNINEPDRCLECGAKTKNPFCEVHNTLRNRTLHHLFSPFQVCPVGWQLTMMERLFGKNWSRVLIKAGRGVGKSKFADMFALIELLYAKKPQFILIVSVSADVSMEHISWIRSQLLNLDTTYELPKTKDSMSEIILSTGSRIKSIPQSEKTRVGYHPTLKIIDELSRISEDFYDMVIRPMGRSLGAREIIISTPYGESGAFGRLYNSRPADLEIYDIGVEDCWWIDEEQLARERETSPTEAIFQQEFLGNFQPSSNNVFPTESIRACVSSEPFRLKPQDVSIGVDFGRKRDHTAIVIYDLATSSIYYAKRLPLGTDWETQIRHIREILSAYPGSPVYIDGTGIGDVLSEALSDFNVTPVVFTAQNKNKMVSRMQFLLDAKKIKIYGVPDLVSELEHFQYLDKNKQKTGASSGFHDDLVCAALLAISHSNVYGGAPNPPDVNSWSVIV